MTLIELPPEGILTRELQKHTGREFSITERWKQRIHGLGRLRYVSGNVVLNNFYEAHQHAVRTHMSWTTQGAVFRIRTVTKLFAFGIVVDDIESVELVRKPDWIYVDPYSIFWALWNLGTPYFLARWFMGRHSWVIRGASQITIRLKDGSLQFEIHGDRWKTCKRMFQNSPHTINVSIKDERVPWDG